MILYMENPKDSTRKLLELIHIFSKVAGLSKVNVQNCYVLKYYQQTIREIKKIIPFKIALIIIKYLGINLIKEVKDLYFENYILKTDERI